MQWAASKGCVRRGESPGSWGRHGQAPKPTHVPITMLSGMQYVRDYSNEARFFLASGQKDKNKQKGQAYRLCDMYILTEHQKSVDDLGGRLMSKHTQNMGK